MKYKILALAITAKCTAKCKLCCFECGPDRTEEISDETISDILLQIKDNKDIGTVSITGGEAMLRYETVKLIIETSKKYNKRVTLITNGFWASSKEKTKKIIQELKEIGLDKIGLSYDDFHAEYIRPENLKNIIDISYEIGLMCDLGIAITKSSKKIDYYTKNINSLFLGTRILQYPCLPVGRASNITDKDFIYLSSRDNLKCPKDCVLTVLYNGDIYPCCNQVVKDTYFCLGNIYKDSINDILIKDKKNMALFILRKYGFDWFIDTIENKLNIDLPNKVISPCHLCKIIFSNKDIITKLHPYMNEFVKTIYLKSLKRDA